MSKRRKLTKAPSRRITLREESLAETKELGLEDQQKQMEFIFEILKQHRINVRLWLEEYLTACDGENPPPDFERFLPWNLSAEDRERLSKDTIHFYGRAKFLEKADGTKYHVKTDGSQEKIDIGSLTWQEFQALTGV